MNKEYSILIGGAAGEGTRMAGLIIGKLFSQYGYRIFIYDDYQSLISGGHNFSLIKASKEKTLSAEEKIDFLLALNQETLDKHKKNLAKGGVIIYNSDAISKASGIGIDFDTITKNLGGKPIMKNSAVLGGFGKVVGMDWSVIEEVLKKEFRKETETNLKIASTAFQKVKAQNKLDKISQKEFPLLTGNEAIALGAVKAGLDIYFAYPMTPATSILHYLASHQKDFDVLTVQAENEIGVINAAIGAAFAGKRTMVGTSGGGFALMVEALSLSAQSETPIVVVDSQRMGPATGVPTYTAQADLLFALSAGHGDFLRFVVAPGDSEETFYLTGLALNIAWQYQVPAIILVDKHISESTFSFDQNIINKIAKKEALLWKGKTKYQRYSDTKSGISPLAFPGQKGIVVKTTSYEHDEFGIEVEDGLQIKKMQEKRLRKFDNLIKEAEKMEAVKVYGNKKSKKALIVWGSTKGVALDVAKDLNLKVVQPLILEPFPEKQMARALKGVNKIIVAETNASGQMAQLLKCQGIKVDNKILKYDGQPFWPDELKAKIKKL